MKRFLIFFLLLSSSLYSKDIYTTRLKVKKNLNSGVDIFFKSNTNQGNFQIYQSEDLIDSSSDLKRENKIFEGNLKGKKSSFIFDFIFNYSPKKNGKFFYFVTYSKEKILDKDIKLSFNSIENPIRVTVGKKSVSNKENEKDTNENLIKKEIVEKFSESTVKKENNKKDNIKKIDFRVDEIHAQIQDQGVWVYWDMNSVPKENMYFRFYRLRGQEDPKDCLKRSADQRITNDFFYEDTEVQFGVPYRYVVLFSTNSQIEDGRNLTEKGVVIGKTLSLVKIEKKVINEKKYLKFDWTNKNLKINKKFPYLIKSITNQVQTKGKKTIKKSTITNKKTVVKKSD